MDEQIKQDEQKLDSTPEGEQTKQEPKQESKSDLKYTDADVDKIIERKFAKWQKQLLCHTNTFVGHVWLSNLSCAPYPRG